YEFKPDRWDVPHYITEKGVQVEDINLSAARITARVDLTAGDKVTGMWCQVYDNSRASDITAYLLEVTSDDSGEIFYGSAKLAVTSSNTPGHKKYWTTSPSFVVKDWDDDSDNKGRRYYSYVVSAYMIPGSDTAIKSCAIRYE